MLPPLIFPLFGLGLGLNIASRFSINSSSFFFSSLNLRDISASSLGSGGGLLSVVFLVSVLVDGIFAGRGEKGSLMTVLSLGSPLSKAMGKVTFQ